MGWSVLGLMTSIAVLAPNALLIAWPPRDPAPDAGVPAPLAWLERAGQALCLVVPAITEPGDIRPWWAVPAAAALATYYGLWARFLGAGRRQALLYAPLLRIPVPMAVTPVVAFLAGAIWLDNPWMAGSALVLAAGHIPVALAARRSLLARPRP